MKTEPRFPIHTTLGGYSCSIYKRKLNQIINLGVLNQLNGAALEKTLHELTKREKDPEMMLVIAEYLRTDSGQNLERIIETINTQLVKNRPVFLYTNQDELVDGFEDLGFRLIESIGSKFLLAKS